MMHPYFAILLEKLETSLRSNDMTPVDRVGPGTLVCMTQLTPQGMMYHQLPFDAAPSDWAAAFKGKTKGSKIGDIKIIAIFDIWPSIDAGVPPAQVFDN